MDTFHNQPQEPDTPRQQQATPILPLPYAVAPTTASPSSTAAPKRSPTVAPATPSKGTSQPPASGSDSDGFVDAGDAVVASSAASDSDYADARDRLVASSAASDSDYADARDRLVASSAASDSDYADARDAASVSSSQQDIASLPEPAAAPLPEPASHAVRDLFIEGARGGCCTPMYTHPCTHHQVVLSTDNTPSTSGHTTPSVLPALVPPNPPNLNRHNSVRVPSATSGGLAVPPSAALRGPAVVPAAVPAAEGAPLAATHTNTAPVSFPEDHIVQQADDSARGRENTGGEKSGGEKMTVEKKKTSFRSRLRASLKRDKTRDAVGTAASTSTVAATAATAAAASTSTSTSTATTAAAAGIGGIPAAGTAAVVAPSRATKPTSPKPTSPKPIAAAPVITPPAVVAASLPTAAKSSPIVEVPVLYSEDKASSSVDGELQSPRLQSFAVCGGDCFWISLCIGCVWLSVYWLCMALYLLFF